MYRMVHSDYLYTIGSTHQFCQDYASARTYEGPFSDWGYAVLSDGCSSAEDAQIGAMLLVKSAEQVIQPIIPRQVMVETTVGAATKFLSPLHLPVEVLSATLLSVVTEDDKFVVSVAGDGVIVARRKSGELTWIQFEYSSGAPYYPRYNLCKEDLESYLKEFPGSLIIRSYKDGKIAEASSPVNEYPWIDCVYIFPFDEYDLVGIMSDGAASFVEQKLDGTRMTQRSLPLQDIVQELFAFKGMQGEFVKRRCQRALRDFHKKNWYNLDDLSIGVVAI